MTVPLSSGRWKLIEPLLDRAIDLPPAAWPGFLESACGTDAVLRADLEQLLLEYNRADTLLDRAASERFGALLLTPAGPPPEVVNGKFRILRTLGQGGMATVYLAHDIRHDRNVALKILRPEFVEAFRTEQFLAEIRTTANLHHPHILPLFDSGVIELPGQQDGPQLPFFVMPFVEGESLRHRINRTPRLEPGEAAQIVREVASALDYAHRHGVVHRDIKPDNILLADGGALVADFGIAVAITAAATRGTERPHLVAGTPNYMSPEQVAGNVAVDCRTDVYALGVVSFEMLAGRLPSPVSAAPRLAGSGPSVPPPSLHAMRSDIPARVDTVLARALARLPGDRFASAGELADALQPGLGISALRSRPARTGMAVAVTSLALAGVLVAMAWSRDGGIAADPRALRAAQVQRAHQTKNVAAYDLYQRGRDQAWSRSPGGTQKAIGYFTQAIAADSSYAAAYAELAHLYALLGNASPGLTTAEMVARANTASSKAVALDDNLADAHAERAFVSMFANFDMRTAAAELDRALALDPGSVRVHRYLTYLYTWTERPADALAEARRAYAMDPLSVEEGAGLVMGFANAGRYDDALAQIAKLRQVKPPLQRIPMMAGSVYEDQEMWAQALDAYHDCCGDESGFTGRVLARSGRTADARKLLGHLVRAADDSGGEAFAVALVYEGLGDYDSTITWLDRSVDDHSMWILIMSPAFARLRSDPRFERIRRRLRGDLAAVRPAGSTHT